ncbi:type III pantothenate kinase [Thauera phenolivorans]|uniref:type III pantothenate kinase n=1 Tax=Thauera phenolivorans TaxID=1792543 RepID=UPI00083ADECE|nr:type III pantothenate kinase [Thauera phenolivorans]
MILLIDAGNTRIKWRLVAPRGEAGWIAEGVLVHEEIASLRRVFRKHPGIERVFGCNVAGPQVAGHVTNLAAAAGLTPEWLQPSAECCGVRNLYDDPMQLGADRWAALIGARTVHAGAALVVTAGTATTVDLLSAEGDFRGGLILPGVDLMLRALASRTAQLPLASGRFSPTPRNTADAIHSGCLQAQAGAVERMFRSVAAQQNAICLLGGGAADSFADLLELPLRRIENLVLVGLATVARAG